MTNINHWPFPTYDKPIMNTTSPAVTAAAKTGYETMALVRAKMKYEQDDLRAELLRVAKEANVGIVHIYDEHMPKGGLTIAFRKTSEYDSGVMVEVAVQVCSHEDSFSKKIGTSGALNKFFDGETIQLPLLLIYGKEDINYAVKDAFTALYHRISY